MDRTQNKEAGSLTSSWPRDISYIEESEGQGNCKSDELFLSCLSPVKKYKERESHSPFHETSAYFRPATLYHESDSERVRAWRACVRFALLRPIHFRDCPKADARVASPFVLIYDDDDRDPKFSLWRGRPYKLATIFDGQTSVKFVNVLDMHLQR